MTEPMDKARSDVANLVERFRSHLDSYRSSGYHETEVRVEYIDPFFEALGWDVHNRSGASQLLKDVVREESVRDSDTVRAPDYSFRIDGKRKFLVEAKKPAVHITAGTGPALQVRAYAWNLRLPLSILTDFEEFAVYDCTRPPGLADSADFARRHLLTFDQYVEDEPWSLLWQTFSKWSVENGSLDRFAQQAAKHRGTFTVDQSILKDIEEWRDMLARSLALRNPTLSVSEMNHAVQATIDRILFLRVAEDRRCEPQRQLEQLLGQPDIYEQVKTLIGRANDRYNSGLFDLSKDSVSRDLNVDDKPLKEIISALYYPASKYMFDVIPVDILGQVYEQFLGKVIRLTPAHRAVVEEKPEVKKAGGVYYTPTYIVDYIVEHTVGGQIKDQTPEQISKLRVLDPACGSGSFLLGAYQHLLDYHLEWYTRHDLEKWAAAKKPPVRRLSKDEWRLTTAEKKRILLNNIYGVDIDRQAVEVTKLNLLLKVLEGENEQTLGQQLKLFQERALPDLGKNIKCGNSLIGPDQVPRSLFYDDKEERRVNAFDWRKEFAEVMKAGGFDVVIGNPPYIRIQTMKEWAPLEVELYKQHYVAASKGNYDIYVVFVEKGLSLLNPHGRLGFILPHKFFNAQYGRPLRELIAKGKHLSHVVHFGDQQVFSGATTYTCLMFLDKAGAKQVDVRKVIDLSEWQASGAATSGHVPAKSMTGEDWNFAVGLEGSLFGRLAAMPVKLGTVAARIYQGPITSADTVMLFKESRPSARTAVTEVLSKELGRWVELESSILRPVVRSGDIGRYHAVASAYVLFPYHIAEGTAELISATELRERYPLAWAYLSANKGLLQDREHGSFKDARWYRFGRTQNLGAWERSKLMVPYMVSRLSAYLDLSEDLYFINVTTGGYGLVTDSPMGLIYLCGLLNSTLLDFQFRRLASRFHGGYYAANKQYIEQLPIRAIDFSDPADAARHARMVELVNLMLELHKHLAAARTEADRELYTRQITATDREIDALVDELYGLTEEEIAIVEGQS